jgi:dTDP-glucose 4,6-dehydratase
MERDKVNRLPARDLQHIFDHTQSLWEGLRGEAIFLTGGTGFVGTWLLESLLWISDRLKLDVSAVVLTREPDRFRTRSPHVARHPAVSLLAGDVQSFAFPEGQFPFVIHAATERICTPDAQDPLGSFGRDVAGTQRVLEFARSHGVRRLLFTSSGAVYGRQPSSLTHIPEEYEGAPATLDTGTVYGQAKRVSEFMCTSYGRSCGFDPLIARLFAFVGPLLPLDANYAVGNFIHDAIAGQPIRIAGDGTPFRSYLYAADLGIWLWTILFRGDSTRAYNVGSSSALTIADLAVAVMRATGASAGIELAGKPVSGAPPLRYVPATRRAEEGLGLRCLIPIEEGIRRTSEWCRATR